MKSFTTVSACLALFAALAAPSLLASAPAPAQARCSLSASTPWVNTAGRYRIEAFSDGPDCARAVATLVIRSSSGAVLHHRSYQAEQVMPLSDARSRQAMQTALRSWVRGSGPEPQTTASLPNWPARADAPAGSEFPFYPEDGVTRDDYLAVKAKRLPYFCYVQGMESLACFVADKGGLEKLGVQTFPG
jgi:hypothetical protein